MGPVGGVSVRHTFHDRSGPAFRKGAYRCFRVCSNSQKSQPPALDPQVQMWTATRTDYPRDRTLAQLFEEVVSASPNSIALVFGDTQLTYAELERPRQPVGAPPACGRCRTGDARWVLHGALDRADRGAARQS